MDEDYKDAIIIAKMILNGDLSEPMLCFYDVYTLNMIYRTNECDLSIIYLHGISLLNILCSAPNHFFCYRTNYKVVTIVSFF